MEELRLLSRSGSPPYTSSISQALPAEPEAVSAEDQWLITREASEKQLRSWATSRQRLLAEVDHLRSHVRSPHVDRAARALEREIRALDRKLTT